jgi:DNA-binding NarL/FixJ family response regulator
VWGELQLDMCEVDLLLQRDQPQAALDVVTRTLAARGEQYAGETEGVLLAARAASALAMLASKARAAGDVATADAHADAAIEYVELATSTVAICRPAHPPAVWLWVLWTLAEAARAAGSPALTEWAAVVSEADLAGRVEAGAAARLRFAEAGLDAGDRSDEVIGALRDSLATAQRLGAAPLLARGHDLARRARLEAELGVTPAPSSTTKNVTLTAREAEVLKLLTDGLTNRQIGRALFISEKTASVHVSNILGKLGATTRTEAAAVARRQGLLAS